MESGRPTGEKKSTAKLLTLLGFSVVAAAGLTLYFGRQYKHQPETETRSVLHLETFVVNLADPDQKTFLRVGIDLEVALPSAEKAKSDAPGTTALIRDTLLQVLTSQASNDLSTPEGKQKLKDAMLQKLNARSPALNAREVYFTEFLIQK